MSSSQDPFQKYSIADEPDKELYSPFLNEALFTEEEADEEWEMRLMELQTPFLEAFEEEYETQAELEFEDNEEFLDEFDEDEFVEEEEETLDEEESEISDYEMDEEEFDEEKTFDHYLLEDEETLEEEESELSYYKMDEEEFYEEIGQATNEDFTADELEWQDLVANELTQRDRDRLFRQILRTSGLRNLRNLYGLDSTKKVLGHLRTIFVGRDRSLIEIRREVLTAKYLRGKQRRKELLLYLKQIAVLDLYSQIQKTTKVSVDKNILIDLPLDELGRIHNLIRDNEEEEIIRRFRTYKQAQGAMRRASNVTKADLRQERMKVASKRGLIKPGEMRATFRSNYYLNRDIMIHAFGAADAYGIDPYMLLGIFFQEISISARKELLRNPRLTKIHSFKDYGLDNAFTLRRQRERRKELQLGKIIKASDSNENKQGVESAFISGLRDIFYYSAAEARRFQDRVISDFNKAGLEKPEAITLITWILIYWNGGQGKSNETISSCNKRKKRIERKRRRGEKVRGIGGWCRLQFAIKRGDVLTILDNRRKTSSRPYLYANRVMGSIETLIRLNIAEITSSQNEEGLGKFLDKAYIEELETFDEIDEIFYDQALDKEEKINEYEIESNFYDEEVEKETDEEFVWSIPNDRFLDDLTDHELEILGNDTRKLIKNTLAVPYRWICLLDIYFRDENDGYKWKLRRGTGTLIGTRHILTCAHGLVPDNGRNLAKKVIVSPARNDRKEPFGNMKTDKWQVSKNWRKNNRINRNFDYALITLEDDISFRHYKGITLGFWGSERMGAGTHLKLINPSALNGRIINIAGYPGDKCRKKPFKLGSCSEKDQGSTQWRGHGNLSRVNLNNRLMLHNVDTMDGQSGSPVWLRYKHHRYLVGIHVSPQTIFINGKKQPPKANVAVIITKSFLREVFSWDKDLELLHSWENEL